MSITRRKLIGRGAAMYPVLGSLMQPFSIAAQSTQEVVVGQVAPLTGPVAAAAKDYVAGAQLYFDQVNAMGGVNGRRIRVVVRDDQFKPELTLKQTRDLLEADKPIALFGFIGTENMQVLAKENVLGKAQIALVAPLTGADQLRSPMDPQVFHIRASYATEAARIVQHLHTLGLRSLAIFMQNDLLGRSGAEGALNEMRRLGIKLAATGSYERAKPDDVNAAVALIANSGAQAVIIVGFARAAGAFTRKFRATGSGAQLYSLSIVNIAELVRIAGEDAARGVGVSQVMPFPLSGSADVVREAQELLRAHQPERTLNYYHLESFIAAKVLVEGLRRAGPEPTRKRVVSALESLREFDVGGFRISFSPNSRVGSRFVDMTVVAHGATLRR